MTAVVILGVIALVVAIVAWVTWHRVADERHSVQHHQSALETLGHVADRRQQSLRSTSARRGTTAKNPAPSRPQGEPSPGRGPHLPHRVPSSARREPEVGGTLRARHVESPAASAKLDTRRRETTVSALPDGADRRARGPNSAGTPSAAPVPSGPSRRDARARVRRTRLAAGVVIVVGGSVAAALVLGRSSPPPTPRSHPARPITAASGGTTSTSGITSASGALVPASPTSFTATYGAPSSPYTVAIDATALCWVMATNPSTGAVVWTGTVAGGGSRSLAVSGPLVVELGAPSVVRVTVDGRPVQLPAGFRSPFSLTFRAGA